MVRHHHRHHLHCHQILDRVPEHLSRKEFQLEWKDEVKAHRLVAGLHLLHHRWESRKAQEAEAEKSQWEEMWIVGHLGQEQEFELYLFPCQLPPKEEQ
jgi:hypothetical protein